MKTTIKDIARVCKVSTATVSLALSDKPSRVSRETKERILKMAKQMNYWPNQVAVSLATKHSRLIGLIINDLRNTHISLLFMAIDQEVQKKGYSLICHVWDEEDRSGQQIARKLFSANVEGIIWAKPYADYQGEENNPPQEFLDQMGVPVITMDDYSLSCEGMDVCFDYRKGGYLAVKHLLECGHERIGCVTGPPQFKVTKERLEGYRRALEEEAIPFDEKLVYYGDFTMESGRNSLSYLLGQKATAIFSFNDEMAFGIYQSARNYGIRIPDGLSLVGFDNVPFADVMDVPLTTIDVPIEEMGHLIGLEMVNIIEGENKEGPVNRKSILYEPNLFLRGSTKKEVR